MLGYSSLTQWYRIRQENLEVAFKQRANNVLENLPIAVDAPFSAYQRQHDPLCLPNTRTDLLQEIYNWVGGRDKRCIFWLSGLAGTGKSTIARTVAGRCHDAKQLGASFFFSRGGGDTGCGRWPREKRYRRSRATTEKFAALPSRQTRSF
jgi:hypothetical protein